LRRLPKRFVHFQLKVIPLFIVIVWLLYANTQQYVLGNIVISGLSSLLGMVGAIFANLSGAGGGIVFIPVFSQLGFSEQEALASSFAIQCFGMTAGAITWSLHYRHQHREDRRWAAFIPIIIVTGLCAVLGLWTAYGGLVNAPSSLNHSFSLFSIIFGVALLTQVHLVKIKANHHNLLHWYDYLVLLAIGYFGGLFTAWLSIAVGEMLVLYLIFRGFDTAMAIASAVVVTAITVWSASPVHFAADSDVVWSVVMFAGPAAIIGGVLAKSISQLFSTKVLKTVLGSWILIMGLLG